VPPLPESPHATIDPSAWGDLGVGGTGAPDGNGYTKIYSTMAAFAALKADGSITVWGYSRYGGTGAPDGNGYTKIYSTRGADPP
jgi:hypothetical protein